ncbi:MAG TPA: hypothetical protein VGQ99_10860 [Tepidisphaeraceae bacterium]|jgi:hypothetical protein|nr:hypothetical protein [Tepidisphaeraceae bacterium]
MNPIELLEGRQLLAVTPIDPANFVQTVNNPYMPLLPGTTYVFKGVQDGKPAKGLTTVTHQTKVLMGVTTTQVHDRVYLKGKLIEDTLDWYAQDKDGNVWYFGEDSKEIENGQVVSTEGSWQAGVNGARPGIVMEAHPKVGDYYRQEFAGKVAADRAKVLNVNTRADVPFAAFSHVLQTKEFTELEPGVVEQKFYARGIGFVRSVMVKGGTEIFNLVAIRY